MTSRPSPFLPATPLDVGDLIRDQVLGLLVSPGPPAQVTPAPLLASAGPKGEIRSFLGHLGLSNPHVEALRRDPRALVIYLGPHAYVSPTWISKPKWAPTWNYALAHFEVEIDFAPQDNDFALTELVTAMEGEQWSVDKLDERYALLAPQILAFHARVVRQTAKFKLGQDETETSFGEILERLGPSPLADQMRKARPSTSS